MSATRENLERQLHLARRAYELLGLPLGSVYDLQVVGFASDDDNFGTSWQVGSEKLSEPGVVVCTQAYVDDLAVCCGCGTPERLTDWPDRYRIVPLEVAGSDEDPAAFVERLVRHLGGQGAAERIHWEGCWRDPSHYACAAARRRLLAEMADGRQALAVERARRDARKGTLRWAAEQMRHGAAHARAEYALTEDELLEALRAIE